jgi:hypothetical protein
MAQQKDGMQMKLEEIGQGHMDWIHDACGGD